MSNLGQKIKEVFTGHHDQDKTDVKTPDVDAPGAFPADESSKHHSDHNKLTKEPPVKGHQDKSQDEERGALHHTGHSHHDPEPETKQATSDAGNYPYWGNLPREGGEHVHRSEGPDSSAMKQHHEVDKESNLAPGTLAAAGTTAAGAGYLASRSPKDQETGRTDEITPVGEKRDSKLDNEESNTNKGAGAAAVAGTTYLATRDKDDADRSEKKSNNPAHTDTSKTTHHTKTSTTSEKPAETATPTKTTSSGDNDSHRKEEEALAAGAGAAGLAGAGYYASQKGDKSHDATRDTGSHGTQGSTIQPAASSNIQPAASRHDPVTEAEKATSAAGNYPYLSGGDSGNRTTQNTGLAEAATPSKTMLSGDNDSHRKEQALATGAGASGLAGAGYLASKKLDDRKEDKQSSQPLGQSTQVPKESTTEHKTHTSTGPHDPEYDAKRATSGAGNYPHWDNDKKDNDNSRNLAAAGLGGAGLAGAGYLASSRAEERKDDLPSSTRETSSGIAAPGSLAQRDTTTRQADPTTSGGIHNTVVGAGSSEYTPPVGSSSTTGTGHQTQAPSQPTQTPAQAAAQQAWNKQQQSASPTTFEDTSKDNKHSDLKYAAAGTAFGAGAAGLAADYGQGKEHETNPRTDESEKIADRALGSDGKPHAPSATHGSGTGNQTSASQGLTSGITALAGQSPSSGSGSKVLHKCDNCGHDNDISRYFNKDAIFRSQQ